MYKNPTKKGKNTNTKNKNIDAAVTDINETSCIEEFKAFARGGLYSINLLNRVWPNILKEYEVDERHLDKLLHKAGLYIRMGKIKSSKYIEDPEESP
jgi:hypothetical protein